ncbi:hypothetical protein D3C76_654860 [compost metagenome]
MHPRAVELIARVLVRVEVRLAMEAAAFPLPEPIPEPEPLEPATMVEVNLADEVLEDIPLASPPALSSLAEQILARAIRGATPEMVAHDLRLTPKRVRQVARAYHITFHRQR